MAPHNKILVVDDKLSARTLLEEYLREQGFVVLTAANGHEALAVCRDDQPDLILLDIMMPVMDGYRFLARYRGEHKTPIIVVSARDEEGDAVHGLDLGADDYVVKPVRMRELLSRVQAALRRAYPDEGAETCLRAGELALDPASHVVTLRGVPVNLTPTEFNLLAILMASPGRVVTREALYDRLIDLGFTGLPKTLNVHIRNLRAKVEPDPNHPCYVETVFGVGYRFNGELA